VVLEVVDVVFEFADPAGLAAVAAASVLVFVESGLPKRLVDMPSKKLPLSDEESGGEVSADGSEASPDGPASEAAGGCGCGALLCWVPNREGKPIKASNSSKPWLTSCIGAAFSVVPGAGVSSDVEADDEEDDDGLCAA
jgi:hypothetical protein